VVTTAYSGPSPAEGEREKIDAAFEEFTSPENRPRLSETHRQFARRVFESGYVAARRAPAPEVDEWAHAVAACHKCRAVSEEWQGPGMCETHAARIAVALRRHIAGKEGDVGTWPGEKCKRCGRRNTVAYTIPDDQWAAIVRGRWNVLCLTCLDEEAESQELAYTFTDAPQVLTWSAWSAQQSDECHSPSPPLPS
jgi:hypothetical protein